jgi:hypothetical protein
MNAIGAVLAGENARTGSLKRIRCQDRAARPSPPIQILSIASAIRNDG